MNIEFTVPVAGERSDLAPNELPTTALKLSQNVYRSEKGRLTIRPGYRILIPGVNPGGRIMGLGYFRTSVGAEKYLAANQTQVWQFDGTAWVNITATPLSGSDIDHVDFTIMETGGVYKAIISNGVNTTKIWDGLAATYSDLGGSPGVTIASAVCANRLCLLQAPNRVKISDFNNPEVYPSGSGFNVNLVDAGDLMIGIESLTRTAIAILGEESQWVGRAQSGGIPMRFERVTEESGPMSSATIINLGAIIYYLADDYNIYKFDGVNCQPVGWAMKPWIESNISVANKKMAHGCYFDKIGKIFWLFPGKGQTGPNLGVHFDPRTGEMGRLTYTSYITAMARLRITITVTWADLMAYPSWTDPNFLAAYPTWESFGDPGIERRVGLGTFDGNVHVSDIGDGSDYGAPIEAVFETPLKSYAGWPKAIVPSTFETFFEKTTNQTFVELSIGTADTLMGEVDYKAINTFDLSVVQRNDIDLTDIREKRFITIRQRSMVPNGQLAWHGGIFIIQPADIVMGPTSDA